MRVGVPLLSCMVIRQKWVGVQGGVAEGLGEVFMATCESNRVVGLGRGCAVTFQKNPFPGSGRVVGGYAS